MQKRQRKKYLTPNGAEWSKTTLYLNELDQEIFEFLKKEYNLNGSALVRHLLTETYTLIKYIGKKI